MIVLLVLVLAVVFIVMNFVDCDILITPIKGIMFGALWLAFLIDGTLRDLRRLPSIS